MVSWQPASLWASGLGCARPLPTARSTLSVFRDLFWHHPLPDQSSLLGKERHLVDLARSCTVPGQSPTLLLTQKVSHSAFCPCSHQHPHSLCWASLFPRGMWLHIKISLGWSMLVIILCVSLRTCPWTRTDQLREDKLVHTWTREGWAWTHLSAARGS